MPLALFRERTFRVSFVTLGLVGQLELDDVVRRAAEKKSKDDIKAGIDPGPSLLSAGEAAVLEPAPTGDVY